jgi:predicted helicase
VRVYEADLKKPEELIHALQLFLDYAPPAIAEWGKAVEEFRERVPQIGASLKDLIETERQTNKRFIAAFDDFCSLCRGSLNPNISIEAVEEMIIQHILTERIFRKIFDVADFIQRNVIAQEIEKVITALNSRVFSRDDFSKKLEHFYGAIENAAATISDFSEKQTFLNTVYERFFQGFCVKVADTHGIVYTPQSLVNFMVESVEHVLKNDFEKTLADRDVHILDPFTGTGNFIVNIMRHIPKSALPHKFTQELHCNEVMLLPYYVASMNIEHAYYEATGKYEPFEGICLVDTFQTMEKEQAELSFFNEKNSARVERQKKAPIRVVIGNPPYNAWQTDENDKNRKYSELDRRIRVTYSDDSTASLKNSLSDPYIKAIRWAADRIGESGVVCLVTNNGFIDGIACDGMRKHLAQDFDEIYTLNLGGNVRKNPKLSGTTHNVFGIQVGVSINLFVRKLKAKDAKRCATIRYHTVVGDWRKEEKYHFLDKITCVSDVKWVKLSPDAKGNWLTNPTDYEFGEFLPVGIRDEKGTANPTSVFSTYCRGITSSRDEWVFSFNQKHLAEKAGKLIENYNSEVARFRKRGKRQADADNFVRNDPSFVKWTDRLKHALTDGKELDFDANLIRRVLYRPFTAMSVYFDDLLIHRRYLQPQFFPTAPAESQNRVIALTDLGGRSPFSVLAANRIVDLHLAASTDTFQCFPLFTYSEDGKERRDNITPKALTLFQIFYDDDGISREDIFHYVYAVLHHTTYRTRYTESLKRELPRIPFVGVATGDKGVNFFPLSSVETMQGKGKPDHNPKASAKLFHDFAAAGKKLADLHVNYESAKEFKLKRVENKEVKLDWRVEAMKLTPDKSALIYNEFLTLEGIPPEAFEYRLGNRSALDWIIDQYRVGKDAEGKIISDPNRMDDEEYIVRHIGQVITVSLETLKIVKSLPAIRFDD